MTDEKTEDSVSLRIVRGPVDSLSLYEITDHELELLEDGSPSSTYLNFGICFITVGLSFITTLVTVKVESVYIFTVFVVLAVVGISVSAVLFVLWRRTRSRTKDLCKRIRARVPTAPISDPVEGRTSPDGPTESNGSGANA